MGLLDMLNSPDSRIGLGLLAAAGPSAVPQSFGQRVYGLLGQLDAQRAADEERKQRAELQQAQLKQMQELSQARQMELAQRKAEQERAARDESIIQKRFQPMPGPMPDGSAGVMPRFDIPSMLGEGLSRQALPEAVQLQQLLNPAPKAPIKLGAGESLLDPTTYKPVASAPKEVAPTELEKLIAARDKLPPGSPLRATFDDAIKKNSTHTPGTTVSVNTGQHGFDNTLKLRSDFRSEPIYKAHQEVQSAHSQITQAIKQASPAGDLAAATKIMKILDPGSVVRESELGMAMAATGLFDRAQFYVQNIMQGTKLTPTQRADFQQLADKLMAESAKAYNAKQSEYGQIAKRNGLNIEDVIGAPAAMPSTSGGWSIKPVGP